MRNAADMYARHVHHTYLSMNCGKRKIPQPFDLSRIAGSTPDWIRTSDLQSRSSLGEHMYAFVKRESRLMANLGVNRSNGVRPLENQISIPLPAFLALTGISNRVRNVGYTIRHSDHLALQYYHRLQRQRDPDLA